MYLPENIQISNLSDNSIADKNMFAVSYNTSSLETINVTLDFCCKFVFDLKKYLDILLYFLCITYRTSWLIPSNNFRSFNRRSDYYDAGTGFV